MSLYHRYRPKRLEDVLGNDETVATLRAALSGKDPPHAYLFCGPYGCGKTTLARIAARMFGGKDDDLVEVDSADFRGIDTIRDIRKRSAFSPLSGSRRTWILDECHKLSSDAQSALLKALEDTPKHVGYFLCTTDPQKLLDTIKSRCAIFPVSLLSELQMKRLVRKVVTGEEAELDKAVTDQIVLDAQGHGRDALQILERVLAAAPEARLRVAKEAAASQSKVIDICRALLEQAPWSHLRMILDGLRQEPPESIRQSVYGYCTSVLLKRSDDRAAAIIEAFSAITYDMGFAGIVYACYAVTNGGSA